MTLPGLLVEYLVGGAVALGWAWHFLPLGLMKAEPPLLVVTLLGVSLYVLGMVLDIIAWYATKLPKKWVREAVHRSYDWAKGAERDSGTLRNATIALYSPELAKELALRSSRDRIARSCVVSGLIVPFVHPWSWYWLAAPLALFAWVSFEHLSYRYELCAERAIDQKLERERG